MEASQSQQPAARAKTYSGRSSNRNKANPQKKETQETQTASYGGRDVSQKQVKKQQLKEVMYDEYYSSMQPFSDRDIKKITHSKKEADLMCLMRSVQGCILRKDDERLAQIVGSRGASSQLVQTLQEQETYLATGKGKKVLNAAKSNKKLKQNIKLITTSPSAKLIVSALKNLKEKYLVFSRILPIKTIDGLSQSEKGIAITCFELLDLIVKTMPSDKQSELINCETLTQLLQVLNVISNKKLCTPDLMGDLDIECFLVALTSLLEKDQTPPKMRKTLSQIICNLCNDIKENFPTVYDPRLIEVHYKSLKMSFDGDLSQKTYPILIQLMHKEPQKYCFELTKWIVDFSLFNEGEFAKIQEDISKINHLSPELFTAIKYYLQGEYASICQLETADSCVLWMQSVIQIDHNHDPHAALTTLAKAAVNRPEIQLEQVKLMLEQPILDRKDVEQAQALLQQVKPHISPWDGDSWKMYACSLEIIRQNQQAKATPAKQSTASAQKIGATASMDDDGVEELEVAKKTTDAAEVTMPSSTTYTLAKATELAQKFIDSYSTHAPSQEGHDEPSSTESPFLVARNAGRPLKPYETMDYKNRHILVNRLLRQIHFFREAGEIDNEYKLYEIMLTAPSIKHMIGFPRILQELFWSVLRSLDDPHRGGFESTHKEHTAAYKVESELNLLCIQLTMQKEEKFPANTTDRNLLTCILDWFNKPELFNNDPEIIDYMRFTMACLLCEDRPHLKSVYSQYAKSKSSGQQSSFLFNQRAKIQLGYTKKDTTQTAEYRKIRSDSVNLQT